ncbi:MAG: hypothetical protein ACM3Q2_17415 [Syntrophothermus sp.]
MIQTLKGIFTRVDEKTRLKYLLAKNDIDDIYAALIILYQHLKEGIQDINICVLDGKIEIISEAPDYSTAIVISMTEDRLHLWHNEKSTLELSDGRMACEAGLVSKVKSVITDLDFYQTGEFSLHLDWFPWRNIAYKIDLPVRKL